MNRDWKLPCRLAAIIIALTGIAYLPTLRAGFLWDDDLLITDNRLVKAGDGLYRFWFTTEASEYYPLTNSLRWLEWRLFGMAPIGYHVVSVLLHAINSVLVWVVLRRLRIPSAWLAGLVFAVHPVNVETVVWISEQKNALSMLFYLVAILLYLRFDEAGQWKWYSFSLVAFLLALLSKTAVVMLPVVLLGCVWWLRGKLRAKDVLCSGPFFLLSLVFGSVTIWVHTQVLKQLAVQTNGFASRLATAGWASWFYLCKALLPVDLMAVYPRWHVDASYWLSYVPGTILIGGLVLFWWKRNTWGRPFLFGLGYFVVMLLPILGFLYQSFYRYSWVADHWLYYSIVAPIALAVAAGDSICRRLGKRGLYWGKVTVVTGLIVLGADTWRRGCVYANGETLWRDSVAKNPDAYVAHLNLGFALAQNGKLDEAIGQFEETLRIKPDYAEARYNLGSALAQLGRTQQAIGEFEQVLRLKPNDVAAHNNLANALLHAGRILEAVQHYEYALGLRPNSAELHYSLGIALEQAGRSQEAIAHYEQAIRLNPEYIEAQNALARLQAAR